METVKYSIRKLYQEGGATRRIGSRSNAEVPLEGAYIPVQLPGESKARIALIEDIFSDSPAFFQTMVKSKAFSIVPGTAVYNESDQLVSASVIWADGTPGEVEYTYTDTNGSHVFTAAKTTGSAPTKTAMEIVTKDESGRDIGTITGEEGAPVTLVAQPLPFTAKQNAPVSSTENTGLQRLTFSPLTAKVQIISEADFAVSADGTNWSFFAEVDPLVSNDFYVRLKDTSTLANLTGKLHFQVEGTLAGECALTGHVGDGTESYPYPIANAYQLNDIRNGLSAYYIQYADISLSSYGEGVARGSDEGWAPIGVNGSEFTGSYDGNGFEITDLYAVTASDNLSLFGALGAASITDVEITAAHIQSEGGICSILAGLATGSTVSKCKVSGSVTSKEGIACGLIANGAPEKCFVNADIFSEQADVAGVVGSGSALNCAFIGTLTAESAGGVAGGVVGRNANGSIVNCFSSCLITSPGTIGGVLGSYSLPMGEPTITSCYWDATLNSSLDNPDTYGCDGLNDVDFKEEANFDGWDFDTIWIMGDEHPELR